MSTLSLYSGHLLTLLMFLIALIMMIRQVVKLHQCHIMVDNPERFSLFVVLYSSTSLSLIFIILQIDWVMSDHNNVVGNATAFLWLFFDTCLAVFIIALSVFIDAVRAKLLLCDKLERIHQRPYECFSLEGIERLIDDKDVKDIQEAVRQLSETIAHIKK